MDEPQVPPPQEGITISLHIDIGQQFTMDEAGSVFLQISRAINQMIGIGLATGSVTAAGPITQQAFGAAAGLEQAAVLIHQAAEQRRAQSGIVSAMPMPSRGPIRMN